jgi:hypothetical protein
MSTIINARSPYYIKQVADTGKTLELVELNLFIYSGVKGTDKPTTATYTLTKTPLTSTANNYVVFEISELIRDYLYTEYYDQAQDAVWVEADIDYTHTDETTGSNNTDYLAFDGFGYFEEGVNPRQTSTPMVLQSNHCINVVNGRDIRIPLFSEYEPTIQTEIPLGVWSLESDYWQESEPTWDSVGVTQQITDSDNSNDKIQYLIIDTENALNGDTITITSTVGTPQTTTITINVICEPKFEKYRAIFYNKFGALQSYWFTQKSTVTTSTKSEMYQRNTIDFTGTPTYDVYKHNKQRFNVTSSQSIQLNTPLQGECLNEPLEQMIMSEYIWLEDSNSTAPVLIKTESIKRMTGVNDKMIRYTVDFEYAYNKINIVR